MPKTSAGLLLYRRRGEAIEVLLVHPGGPFWKKRDLGAWSIPKGEVEEDEEPLAVAKREFEEETGTRPEGEPVELGEVKQKGGKRVRAWALEGDLDPAGIESDTFTIEWPPGSGKMAEFPEVDRAEWFSVEEARDKINPAQVELIDRLVERLGSEPS